MGLIQYVINSIFVINVIDPMGVQDKSYYTYCMYCFYYIYHIFDLALNLSQYIRNAIYLILGPGAKISYRGPNIICHKFNICNTCNRSDGVLDKLYYTYCIYCFYYIYYIFDLALNLLQYIRNALYLILGPGAKIRYWGQYNMS